jgi:uncharacterized membrane protein (UPF0127 family)
MRALKRTVPVVACAILGAASCYQRGETIDLDLRKLDKVELRAGNLRVISWVARTPAELAKGLAVVEVDRLTQLEDGAHPGMVYVLPPSAAMPEFRLRLQVMDVAVLSANGEVIALSRLPAIPERVPGSAYVLELTAGNLAAAGVGVGARFIGLDEIK